MAISVRSTFHHHTTAAAKHRIWGSREIFVRLLWCCPSKQLAFSQLPSIHFPIQLAADKSASLQLPTYPNGMVKPMNLTVWRTYARAYELSSFQMFYVILLSDSIESMSFFFPSSVFLVVETGLWTCLIPMEFMSAYSLLLAVLESGCLVLRKCDCLIGFLSDYL